MHPKCEWFALCDNYATHTKTHPVLGEVPICDRCEALVPGTGRELNDREKAIVAGHVWSDFNGCEEHVCALDLSHDGPCICGCYHDSNGYYHPGY